MVSDAFDPQNLPLILAGDDNEFVDPRKSDKTELAQVISNEGKMAEPNFSRDWDLFAHPTLPSKLIPSSFCASTANSIGSCFSTSRAKPLTISATALSVSRPRICA